MARLGLTCKDAFVVFSQNETLKLQKQVKELETRLAKYEPEPRFFESEQIWEDVRDEADAVLRDWIQKNVTVPETVDYADLGLVLDDAYDGDAFREAIIQNAYSKTQSKEFSERIAGDCLRHVLTAMEAIEISSTEELREELFEDIHVFRSVILNAITDFMNSFLEDNGIIEYPTRMINRLRMLFEADFSSPSPEDQG